MMDPVLTTAIAGAITAIGAALAYFIKQQAKLGAKQVEQEHRLRYVMQFLCGAEDCDNRVPVDWSDFVPTEGTRGSNSSKHSGGSSGRVRDASRDLKPE